MRPATPKELALACQEVGVSRVQVHLDPIRLASQDPDSPWNIVDTVRALARAGITICSGMMTMEGEDYSTLDSIRRTGGVLPDEHWDVNRQAAVENARIARRLGLSLVTLHAGFIPEGADDPQRRVVLDRIREIAAIFALQNVAVGLETGQETADTLLVALEELNCQARDFRVGVNFDPANMILYGMGDPVAALRQLAPYVVQIHLKDALPNETPGTWGREVVVGEGAVDWPAFLEVLRPFDRSLDLVLEREAGETRIADLRSGHQAIAPLVAAVNIGAALPPPATP